MCMFTTEVATLYYKFKYQEKDNMLLLTFQNCNKLGKIILSAKYCISFQQHVLRIICRFNFDTATISDSVGIIVWYLWYTPVEQIFYIVIGQYEESFIARKREKWEYKVYFLWFWRQNSNKTRLEKLL